MSIYAISDLHLSLGSVSKQMDIFDGWENYVDRLQQNWIRTVQKCDTVVVAGDISWGMSLSESIDDFRFLDSLPGKKILLKGNHDYWWSTRNKMENFFAEHGFSSLSILFNSTVEVEDVCVCGTKGFADPDISDENLKLQNREAHRLELSLLKAREIGKDPLVFLHYPPIYKNYKSMKILNVLMRNHIDKCYYGHVHGVDAHQNIFKDVYKDIKFSLISCDYLNFNPILVK